MAFLLDEGERDPGGREGVFYPRGACLIAGQDSVSWQGVARQTAARLAVAGNGLVLRVVPCWACLGVESI